MGPWCPDEYSVFLGRQTTHAVFFFNHNAIGERFQTKFAKLKIVSPAAMAKLAIDRVSIATCKKIGRFSLKIGRSGDFHYFIKNREISRKIGRLGSSAHVFMLYRPFQYGWFLILSQLGLHPNHMAVYLADSGILMCVIRIESSSMD